MENDIIDFFKNNPLPIDSDLHSWAQKKGYNIHKVETQIYKLATMAIMFLAGGKANELKVTEKDVDSKQMDMGEKVEMEHVTDFGNPILKPLAKQMTRRISLDHLAELLSKKEKKYYDLLKKYVEQE